MGRELTARMLEAAGARADLIASFREVCGEGGKVTLAQCKKLAQSDAGIVWIAQKLLLPTAWAEFLKAEEVAWAKYERVRDAAWAAYQNADAAASAEHEIAEGTAFFRAWKSQ